MRKASWLAEYYPVEASKATGSELGAARHSLQKWRGLTPEARKKHRVVRRLPITVGGESCALCRLHSFGVGWPLCQNCILTEMNGASCDRNEDGPWRVWVKDRDPSMMIDWLERAVTELEGRKQ